MIGLIISIILILISIILFIINNRRDILQWEPSIDVIALIIGTIGFFGIIIFLITNFEKIESIFRL